MKKKKRLDTLVVGGLHLDDFEWASREHEEAGYVLVGFVLDFDGYHWKAVYVEADVQTLVEMKKREKASPCQTPP